MQAALYYSESPNKYEIMINRTKKFQQYKKYIWPTMATCKSCYLLTETLFYDCTRTYIHTYDTYKSVEPFWHPTPPSARPSARRKEKEKKKGQKEEKKTAAFDNRPGPAAYALHLSRHDSGMRYGHLST